ncbi:NCS2 family permease [Halanaerobium sp. MA284_MarDTE_T2]|uniref:NCS2 family permease n=1 Tax=Halanaerobium sp. MA284_MarDTE_T2 TaxID=2183913 RepID=UPI000DF21E66|nr:NCS2 family permease [Halanaerobium sp. MA284_MarDTE_T2]RCW50685.1 AGZA family xanthine/uracil permease-like MFS transporter [Halanaerobium sp. MA284_MarDTE_T2]
MEEQGFLDNVFKLKQNNTNVKTETIAGITTFMTMAYIIFVNPSILEAAGMPFDGVFIATIAGAILGTLTMALLSNYPFALASGMGLNAFFAYSVVIGMGVPWQTALGIVFIEGILFIILSVTPVREMIVNSIPMALKTGISTGIGLFIAFIGLQNAGIVVADQATLVAMGSVFKGTGLVAIFGLVVTGILHAKNIKGSLLWGILASTAFGWINGVTPKLEGVIAVPHMSDWSEVLLQLDIDSALSFGMVGVLLSFLFVDMFDTAGTLVGVSQQAGYLDENGDLPKASRALLADAIGTTGGALFGTTTVTTYVESASGVAEGGRTGLTGVVVSILFFLSLFFKPLIGIVPAAATAPALIIVGTMMMTNITNLNWDDFTEILPAFVTMITMPLTYSISNGIALGFIVYPLVKLFTGKGKDVHWLVYVLGIVFVLYFFLN